MKHVVSFALSLVLAFFGLLIVSVAKSNAEGMRLQPPPPLVRCEPTAVAGVVGEEVQIDLYIEDIANLYAVDVRPTFDPSIATVVDQSDPFPPGVQIQPLYSWFYPFFLIYQDADNVSGLIRYAATQALPTPPAAGSGPLARVTFLGVTAGTFPMNWSFIQLGDPSGTEIPAAGQPCSVTFAPPLAVTLGDFVAASQADHVLVSWETVSELGNLGFNLYRSPDPGGSPRQLNASLIPSQDPGSGQGFAYQWQDFDVEAGTTYFYWLEDVSTTGGAQMHGPASTTYQQPSAVALASLEAGAQVPVGVPFWSIPLLLLLTLAMPALAFRNRSRA